ncbi:hypothetical protein Y032_0017g3280 [Ancylostoma ceylanicum]|uniref:Uncharacterized protein n=1 Tax=Ancylostoma ceylanicum TaxID=53326 RepID=A0A016V4B8_9BILA|nr:hypothetical protein Y032_0017g3280 [Ancylostoma ceylanicum]
MLNDWRNEYHAAEIKAEARLYGRYYLRVVNLDAIDKLCDEVLGAIDATASSLTTQTEATELVKGTQEKSAQKDFDNGNKHAPSSPPRVAGGVQKIPSISKSNNNQEVAKPNKEDEPEQAKKNAIPKQGRVTGPLVSRGMNALQLTPTTARSRTTITKDTTQPTRSEGRPKNKTKTQGDD